MKKKIVFKIQEFPHVSETFIITQVITAINIGFDVKVLVKKILPFHSSKQDNLIEKYNLPNKIIIEDYNIPKNKIVRVLKWLYLVLVNIAKIPNVIAYHKNQKTFSLTWLYQYNFYKQFTTADVFHIQYGTNKFPVDVLKKSGCLKTPIVVSFHGHDAFFPINGHIQNHNYYTDLFNEADAVIANTPYLAKQIENIGCNPFKIDAIRIGVNTTFFYPKKIEKYVDLPFKIICVGRLAKVKGHIFALKAIKKLIDDGFNVNLTIVGEGEEYDALSKYVENNNLISIVNFVGAKSQSEIRDLFWDSNLFLFPSITLESGRAETQGLATIEAQACGLPVVAFDTGGIKYTLKDAITGYLCKAEDFEMMAEKVAFLVNTPEILFKMKTNAPKFVAEHYAQSVIDKKWNKVYNELIKNG